MAHGLTPLSDTTRLLYANLAVAYADETATDDATPDMLVGDFNSVEDSAVHAAVVDAGYVDTFRQANPGVVGATADQDPVAQADTATERIDYVFARPGGCGLQVRSSAVIANHPSTYQGGSLWPSDHHGVVSELACAQAAPGQSVAAGRSENQAGGVLAATGGGPPVLPLVAAGALAALLALGRLHRVAQHDRR
jgi:endonuclease/exonuclease/phosphatase family metal-dependent hydrolase